MSLLADALPMLRSQLTRDAEVLDDHGSNRFQELARRWSDGDIKIPGAMVLPSNEVDCQTVVKWATSQGIPIVLKSGGHSQWSSIGKDGVVIDLTKIHNIKIVGETKTVQITGSVLSKQVSTALAAVGLFTPMGNGNTVGAIPYFLGGGGNIFLATTGYAADTIIAARVVTASGDIVLADPSHNQDLLWALRGAGQYFGLVLSITVPAYPLSKLGSPSGLIWSEAFLFPLDRAMEIAEALEPLMNDATYNTTGLLMPACRPPAFQPALVVSVKLIGDPNDAPAAFKVLYDLKPLAKIGGELKVEDLGNALDRACEKGGFKHYSLTGAHAFQPAQFIKTVKLWQQLIIACPDATESSFYTEWHSRHVKLPTKVNAMSHHDIQFWHGNLLWFEKETNSARAMAIYEEVLQNAREGQPKIDFPNCTRTRPAEWRYRGDGKLAQLRALKQKWDPTGVFTRQLLD